jgi:ring-1,2-phenylacetyl-CoA epoxidase subunit PaaD
MVTKARAGATEADLERELWDVLAEVRDPEIPPCSITDLGIVERVLVSPDRVDVDLLPTFAGCPALDVISEDVSAAVIPLVGEREVRVRFVYSTPWTSDRITDRGREAMRSYGLTPPGTDGSADAVFIPLAAFERAPHPVTCPFCGSRDTVLESAFGPTLCRATHFCRACRNPFESFKPKSTR